MVGLYYCSDLCRLCRHNKTSRTSRRSHYFRTAWMKSVHLSNFFRANVHFTSFLYICINNLAKVKSIHGDFIKSPLCWHKPQKTQTIPRNVAVVGWGLGCVICTQVVRFEDEDVLTASLAGCMCLSCCAPLPEVLMAHGPIRLWFTVWLRVGEIKYTFNKEPSSFIQPLLCGERLEVNKKCEDR